MSDQQKHDLATALHVAWGKYVGLLGEPPHGTLPQLKALIELAPLQMLVEGIGNKAVAAWYSGGQR